MPMMWEIMRIPNNRKTTAVTIFWNASRASFDISRVWIDRLAGLNRKHSWLDLGGIHWKQTGYGAPQHTTTKIRGGEERKNLEPNTRVKMETVWETQQPNGMVKWVRETHRIATIRAHYCTPTWPCLAVFANLNKEQHPIQPKDNSPYRLV